MSRGVPPSPGRNRCGTMTGSQNMPAWKRPLRIIESGSFWTRSINTGGNTHLPAVGQVCFRGGLLSLLRACVGPPGRDNRPDQKRVQAAKPLLAVSSRTGVGRDVSGRGSFGWAPAYQKQRPWWKMQPEAFWGVPITVPGHQGGCLGGCHSAAGGSRQSIMATVGKASVSEQENYTRGQEDAHGSTSLLSCWWTRVMGASLPCNRASSNLTKQGPSTVSQ